MASPAVAEQATSIITQVLQENLDRGLTAVKPAISRKSTLPITTCVKLETLRGQLALTATDLDIAIRAWVGAKIDREGAICLPYREFAGHIASMPRATVAIDGATIDGARSSVTFNPSPAEDFPRIPAVDGVTFEVDPKDLTYALAYVDRCISADESRPVLTGALFTLESGKLTIAGTDGYRLAVTSLDAPGAPSDISGIVPATAVRAVMKLAKLAAKDRRMWTPIQISMDTARIHFAIGSDYELTAQLIRGTYPNYRKLIPDHPTHITVSRDELKRVVTAAAKVAQQGSGIIRFHYGPNALTASAKADEIAEISLSIDATSNGSGKIAFNSRYLADVLATAGADIVIHVNGNEAQAMFTSPDAPASVLVVMPMLVAW